MDIQVFAIKALQLICCISLLVVLHELGHFGFSRLFKVKVEKFYIFFNPKFHLFSTRDKWFTNLFPYFKNNQTEYGIGWIPLGGYVKIAGMVDESLDVEQMKQPVQSWEFRAQKVWKRFFIMAGGVLMNLLTSLVLYSIILYTWGYDYIPMRSLEDGFQFNEYAQSLGFEKGDIPIKADGEEILEYSVSNIRTISNASTITVLRAGEEVVLQMPEEGLNMLEIIEMTPEFMTPIAPIAVGKVIKGSPAYEIGMRKGDLILSINDIPLSTWADYDEKIFLRMNDVLESPTCTAEDSMRLRELKITYLNNEQVQIDTTMILDEHYRMGVLRMPPRAKIERASYSVLSCIPAGIKQGFGRLTDYVNDLKYVPSKKGAESVGSFVSIGSIFPETWNWEQFWNLTALISIMLAVMNVLPIPGLDGGHMVLLAYEAIVGKQPSDKVMMWIERIGICLILCLMLIGFRNDIVRVILPALGW